MRSKSIPLRKLCKTAKLCSGSGGARYVPLKKLETRTTAES